MEEGGEQKVGDEVLQNQVKKGVKRKPEFQMVYCSVCKVSLNSSSQADAHYAGRSHQNKARSQVSGAVQPKVPEPPPVPSPVGENLKCELCQKSFNSSSQMKAHLSGKAHQLLAKSRLECSGLVTPNTVPKSTPVAAEGTPAGNNDGVEASVPDHIGPPPAFGANLTGLFHCELCNITLNSQKQMEQHNKGLRHKILTGKAKPPQVTGEKWENVRFMKIANAVLGINKDTVTGSGGGMNLRQFNCEKCNITVNSQTQLDQHLQSQKHKLKGTEQDPKRKRGAANVRGGRRGGRGFQRNDHKPPYHGKRNPGPYVPPLSTNFVRGNTGPPRPRPNTGYYPKQYHTEDFSQNWNSNYIYDMPTNVAMF